MSYRDKWDKIKRQAGVEKYPLKKLRKPKRAVPSNSRPFVPGMYEKISPDDVTKQIGTAVNHVVKGGSSVGLTFNFSKRNWGKGGLK